MQSDVFNTRESKQDGIVHKLIYNDNKLSDYNKMLELDLSGEDSIDSSGLLNVGINHRVFQTINK